MCPPLPNVISTPRFRPDNRFDSDVDITIDRVENATYSGERSFHRVSASSPVITLYADEDGAVHLNGPATPKAYGEVFGTLSVPFKDEGRKIQLKLPFTLRVWHSGEIACMTTHVPVSVERMKDTQFSKNLYWLVLGPWPAFPVESMPMNSLELRYVSEFDWVWSDIRSGAIFDGDVFRPKAPEGFHPLAFSARGPETRESKDHAIAEMNKRSAIVARARKEGALKPPLSYEWLGNDSGSGATYDLAWWRPIPPPGYVALGTAFSNGAMPSFDAILCVHGSLTTSAKGGKMLYASRGSGQSHNFSIFEVKPRQDPPGLNVGGVVAVPGYYRGGPPAYDGESLKTLRASMDPEQDTALSKADVDQALRSHRPTLYFHANEKQFPMRAEDFLADSIEVPPNNLDVKHPETLLGNLNTAKAYVFVKKVHPQFTDLQIWFFYGGNGKTYVWMEIWDSLARGTGSKNFGPLNSGSHTGDWEHVNLRVDNATKEVVAVGYSSHGDTVWYKPPARADGEMTIPIFSALNMHGCYPSRKTTLELAGWDQKNFWIKFEGKVWSRNMTGSGVQRSWNVWENYEIVSSNSFMVVPPAFLETTRRWGPAVVHEDHYDLRFKGIPKTFSKTQEDNGPETPSFKFE